MSLSTDFNERKDEINEYIEFLDHIDILLKEGIPLLRGKSSSGYSITARQQKILSSSLYLQLYNLVESTVSKCLTCLEKEIKALSVQELSNINTSIKKEWIHTLTKNHMNSSIEKRSDAILKLVDHILCPNNFLDIELGRGPGGNWDDIDIEKLTRRIGMDFTIPKDLAEAVKRPMYDDKRRLELIKYIRNKLAHGELSFVECGERLSISELKELADTVYKYLEILIAHFDDFIQNRKFYVAVNS